MVRIGGSGVASSKIHGEKILKKFINVWGASSPTPPPNYPAQRVQMYWIFLNMRLASFDKDKGNMQFPLPPRFETILTAHL